jgi:hypothetical protein
MRSVPLTLTLSTLQRARTDAALDYMITNNTERVLADTWDTTEDELQEVRALLASTTNDTLTLSVDQCDLTLDALDYLAENNSLADLADTWDTTESELSVLSELFVVSANDY